MNSENYQYEAKTSSNFQNEESLEDLPELHKVKHMLSSIETAIIINKELLN